MRYALPILLIPYLTRTLGPEAWGALAIAIAVSVLITLVVDYGFALSASRAVAQAHGDGRPLGPIVGGTNGAKLMLAVLAISGLASIHRLLPFVGDSRPVLFAAAAFGVIEGFSLFWYFVGLQRVAVASAIRISARLFGVVLTFYFVREAGDEWRYLAINAAVGAVVLIVLGTIIVREVGFQIPTWWAIRESLSDGFTLFQSRVAVVVYTAGSTLVLGFFAQAATVGLYSISERLLRAVVRLVEPASAAIYPRIVLLVRQSPERAIAMARRNLVGLTLLGCALSLGLFVFGGWVVVLIGGAEFEAATPIVRTLALAPLPIAVSTGLGTLWMLPNRLDRPFLYSILVGAVVNIVLVLALAPAFEAIGSAWAVVIAEFVVVGVQWMLLRKANLLPTLRTVRGE